MEFAQRVTERLELSSGLGSDVLPGSTIADYFGYLTNDPLPMSPEF